MIKNENKNHPCLKNISLEINKNSFAILTGEVGSGKTSLLQVLTGEVVPKSGSILVNGRISYASQDPCLFEGTYSQFNS